MKKVGFMFAAFAAASMLAGAVPVPGWTDLAAEKVVPMGDNAAAVRLAPGKFSLPADMAVLKADRASWDFPIRIDMRRRNGLEFDFFCSGAKSISGLNMYFKSGGGWYSGSIKTLVEEGWHRLTVRKSMFARTEGKVAGWGKVSALRVSAWRCGKGKVELGIGDLSFNDEATPLIGVVRADSCVANPKYRSECKNFATFSSRTFSAIENAGIPTVEMSDTELDAESLEGLKLLVFPYNPSVPEKALQAIRDFVAGGGRLFACHSTDPEVRKVLGLSAKRYNGRNWSSSSETPTAEPHGFYLSHVWRYSPDESMRQAYNLLLRVEPAWKEKLDNARKVAEEKARADAEWIASRPSKPGEWRAFWCHSARGLGDRSWDDSIRLLKENGFNAILPNLAWGGTAFYRSSVLPVHSTVATEGDAFKDCIAACRKYGVECHVWKVCWNIGSRTDKKDVERYRAEGRLQRDLNGNEKTWLCPSRPENLAQEIDAFVELAKMGPDGVHFDYIRYPDSVHCFCDHCRSSFEKRLGHSVAGWPTSVGRGTNAVLKAEWRKFRCDNVTALVRGVAERVRRETPGMKLSAAVFPSLERDPGSIGQDWGSWCREGLLDFVCPMDYSGNFGSLAASQKESLDGCPVKLRPGIGLSCWFDASKDAITLTKQIEDVRRIGLDGFVVFNFDRRAVMALPVLHTGPTR